MDVFTVVSLLVLVQFLLLVAVTAWKGWRIINAKKQERLMGRYRKKPVEVIAHRIGDDGWPREIWQGVSDGRIILNLTTVAGEVQGDVTIHTREGTLKGYPGEWIIRGVQGEFYPCAADIFETTYEPAHGEGG